MLPQVFTFCDSVHDLEEFAREADISASGRSIRSAIRRAYREIVDAHAWTCLRTNGRILIEAAQDDGTVSFDFTGGSYERQLTLTGDTWPTDAEDWAVQITTDTGTVVCDIESRKSASVVTLDATMNPGQDVAAGAEFVAYRRYYRLPNDFQSLESPVNESLASIGRYITPQKMLEIGRRDTLCGDTVQYFTIAPVPDLYGAMGLFLDGYLTESQTLDFIYKRKPRELRYVGTDLSECPGTITVVAGSAAIAGTTTTFASGHIGSLLRIGSHATRLPTGLDGLLPYVEQRTITSCTSATSIATDAVVTAAASGVKYSITDPIDLEGTVYDAMMAMAKKYVAIEKNSKNWQQIAALADESLFRAKCGDNRVTQRRVAGIPTYYEPRLSDSPRSHRPEEH